jgi:hypothetical protein
MTRSEPYVGLSRMERIAKENIRKVRSPELPSQTPCLLVISINRFSPISNYYPIRPTLRCQLFTKTPFQAGKLLRRERSGMCYLAVSDLCRMSSRHGDLLIAIAINGSTMAQVPLMPFSTSSGLGFVAPVATPTSRSSTASRPAASNHLRSFDPKFPPTPASVKISWSNWVNSVNAGPASWVLSTSASTSSIQPPGLTSPARFVTTSWTGQVPEAPRP